MTSEMGCMRGVVLTPAPMGGDARAPIACWTHHTNALVLRDDADEAPPQHEGYCLVAKCRVVPHPEEGLLQVCLEGSKGGRLPSQPVAAAFSPC